jgi:hypothetical protein
MATASSKVWVGPIPSNVCGRTDHLPVNVPSGAYVFPADFVSGLGEGNTIAGFEALNGFLGRQAYDGGETTEVVVAGGEYVAAPKCIAARIGGGDLNRGHEVLDEAVVKFRKKLIDTLKKLPGPKRD